MLGRFSASSSPPQCIDDGNAEGARGGRRRRGWRKAKGSKMRKKSWRTFRPTGAWLCPFCTPGRCRAQMRVLSFGSSPTTSWGAVSRHLGMVH